MTLWEQITSKEVDIYISLFVTIVGLIFGILIDIIRKNNIERRPINNSVQVQNSVTINKIFKVSKSNRKYHSKRDDQEALFIVGAVLLALGITYLFFRSEILTILTYVTILSISTLVGGVINSIYQGYYSGLAWSVYVIFTCLTIVGAIFVVNKAINPNFAPKYFDYSQEIINSKDLKN